MDGGRPGSERWRFETGGGISSGATVVEDVVYVVATVGVYALDTTDGRPQWRTESVPQAEGNEKLTVGPPAVADDFVYAGFGNAGVAALSTATGDPLWWTEASDLQDTPHWPVVAGGTVFTSALLLTHALDAASGQQEWSYEHGRSTGGRAGGPVVADGRVYVGDREGTLHALDAGTGDPVWRTTLGDGQLLTPTVADGRVYVGDGDGVLHALDAADGGEVWHAAVAEREITTAPTVRNGTLFVGLDDSLDWGVGAFSTADGSERWRFDGVEQGPTTPTVAGDTVYVGEYKRQLYAIDAADGSLRWTFDDLDRVKGTTVVDGTVYVTDEEGVVHALRTANPTATSDGSMARLRVLGHHDRGVAAPAGSAADDTEVYVPGEAGSDTEVYAPGEDAGGDTEVYAPGEASGEAETSPEGDAGSNGSRGPSAGGRDDPPDADRAASETAGSTVTSCPSCGTDVSGLDAPAFCPDCGTGLRE